MRRESYVKDNVVYWRCKKCGEFKPIDDYMRIQKSETSRRGKCRECMREIQREYRQAHILKYREYKKKRRDNNKEKMAEIKKKYDVNNREKLAEYSRIKRKQHNEELGFNREAFHIRARRYIKRKGIKLDRCQICGGNERIQMHHPYYDKYDRWSEVVFCCQSCHNKIHAGLVACPEPINLLIY